MIGFQEQEDRQKLKFETTMLYKCLTVEREIVFPGLGAQARPPSTGRHPQAIRKTISPEYVSV